MKINNLVAMVVRLHKPVYPQDHRVSIFCVNSQVFA